MRMFSKILSVFLLIVWDCIATAASIVLGIALYGGFSNKDLTPQFFAQIWEFFLLTIIMLLLCNVVLRCYSNVWKHAGMAEYLRQIVSVLLSTVIIIIINLIYSFAQYPELIIIISCLELILVLTARASIRFFFWLVSRVKTVRNRNQMVRVAIFGAGEAGTNLVHKLLSHPEDKRRPVCFIDDNESLWGKKVYGLPVVGGRKMLDMAISAYNVGEVIMAVSNTDHDTIKELLIVCHQKRCPLRRFGVIDDVDEKSFSRANISDLNLEDLLRRDSVKLNMQAVDSFIENKTVLVTGGAGSIGSEICRQVMSFGAK